MNAPLRLGALPEGDGTRFRVWAPAAEHVTLVLEPENRAVPLDPVSGGYFEHVVDSVSAGQRYRVRLDDGDPLPDPASRFQPEGVHGPSEVVNPEAFSWGDAAWGGVAQRDLVFYELHVGTFTPEGTFCAATERLEYLRDLGVTAVELMPVADFPGRWNWGYDGAALYAPSRAYGTPDDLRALVDRAHGLGLAVFLDAVYNHLGPDGAYLAAFGPVFTDKHRTPWGDAINLDDDGSRGVRDLILDNALYWLREYHLDGLRLDATHALVDDSEPHLLAELSEAVAALPGPRRVLVAEDHRNLNTLLLPRPDGFGLDAVWADDLHHLVRNIVAGDTEGYYADFADATTADIAETVERGWFYDGRPSKTTAKPRGTSADPIRPAQCVVCIQNHDQIGNRPAGDRLPDSVEPAAYRAASALLLFAPELPLLFMGQEWAATAPFQFFTDHNAELGPLVSAGRRSEFEDFPGFGGAVPDPQDASTFERSRLDWDEREAPGHAHTLALYHALLALRRDLPDGVEAEAHGERGLHVRRGAYHLLLSFADDVALPLPDGAVVLHTEQHEFAADPLPPEVADGTLRFTRPGAVLVRT
ncbi:MAG: malto-oligosyltrehalose trehalohydrolase [Rhodothermales bacterium]